MTEFKLSDQFVDSFAGKQPDWGFSGLGYIVYKRTYARPIENRSEEWWETCKRVVEGTYNIQKQHCQSLRLPWNPHKAQKSAQKMFQLMWDFKFLPPGRGLWMMGTEYLKVRGGAAANNCAFISTKEIATDFAEPFCFLMDMSMLGVGVGGDTKGAGEILIKEPKLEQSTYIVEDSREGWVELLRVLLLSYVHKTNIPTTISFDCVRAYGTPIKGFGGTSSGPEPLKQLVEDIHLILKPLINHLITSTAIVDLFNCIGRCVVSGNVRRTAEIMFGNPEDKEFLELKNPDLANENLQKWRWASNNSVIVETNSDYSQLVNRTIKNGEPGYLWLNNARDFGRMIDPPNYIDKLVEGTNPCGEQSLESYELCCLCETFPHKHDSLDEYLDTLKYAYLYAKTVTLIPTHNERTNAVMMRNRRIGMSQSGIVQSFAKHGLREHFRWCNEGYKYLKDLDRTYSRWMCVPASIKITSVKPSGTVSLLCGATPGIHFPYSEYYWRTVRFDSHSPLLKLLKKANYKIVQGETETTSIVYFPIKEDNFSRSRDTVTIWEQLEIAAQMQAYWADNQVSVTVTFHPEECSYLKTALELYSTRLKSVSFLPILDHKYDHAPYQSITKVEYEEAKSKLKSLNLSSITDSKEENSRFCDSATCVL